MGVILVRAIHDKARHASKLIFMTGKQSVYHVIQVRAPFYPYLSHSQS